MPRPKSSVPSYRKHKASGRGVVAVAGKDIYLPGAHRSAESRAAYARIVAECRAASGQHPLATSDAITVVELFIRYWKEHVASYYVHADGTPTGSQHAIKHSLAAARKLYGRTPAREFGPLALKAIREGLIREGFARKTVNSKIGDIKRAFRWGVENELVPSSVIHGLDAVRGLRRGRSPARETEPVRPVADFLVDATVKCVSPVVASMVQIQRLTGMRSGELVIMRGCDIDTSGKIWAYTPATHKTAHHGHARRIYLGPQAQDAIRPYLKPDLSGFLFSPAETETITRARRAAARRTPLSCGNRAGTNRTRRPSRRPRDRYTPASFARAVQRGCDKAFPLPDGLDDEAAAAWRRDHRWHPHQLRHNAATRLRKEFGIEAARVVLGHKSALVTEIYAEIDHVKAAEIMWKVG